MQRNLVASLFEHGQVRTTQAKAKSFRPFAEKLITQEKVLILTGGGPSNATEVVVLRMFRLGFQDQPERCGGQVGQGRAIIWPLPRQTGQALRTVKNPWLRETCPLPPHWRQVSGWCPGSQPLPLHSMQISDLTTSISVSVPKAAAPISVAP